MGSAESNEPPAERRPVTVEELRRRAVCKKRYGRASLTIHRWGKFGELLGESALAKEIDASRSGATAAEDVAWAFVRSRVKTHSPTFQWETAELGRLVRLVTECSRSPHFEAQTAEDLAAELVKAQDDERERLGAMSQQFADTFRSLAGVGRSAMISSITGWAERQRGAMEAVSRSLAPSWSERMRAVGLASGTARQQFPVLEMRRVTKLLGARYGTMPRYRVHLPDATYRAFSESLHRSLRLYGTETRTPWLDALARTQAFTISDVVRAAGEAAELAARHGQREEAVEIESMTASVVAIVEDPSVAMLEQMVDGLSERLVEHFEKVEERLNEIDDQHEQDKEDRNRERQADLWLNFFLWFLALYLALFMWLLEHLSNGN